jgi:subtilisin family serine protease
MEGTSMAAPFVAGSIALLASSESHKNLDASQLKEHLLNTSNGAVNPNSAAVTIDPPVTGLPIHPQEASDTKISKYGLIDIGKAVKTSYYGDNFVPVTGIKLTAPATSLLVGESVLIAAEIKPPNASDKSLEWSSSDDSVAVVDSSGLVNALAAGSAIIMARSVSGGVEGNLRIDIIAKDVEENNNASGGGCKTGAGIAIILILAAFRAGYKRL